MSEEPHIQLIRALCRAFLVQSRPNIPSGLKTLNEAAFIKYLIQHKCVPIANVYLEDIRPLISEKCRKAIQAKCRRRIIRSMAMHREGEIIRQACAENNIWVEPYKGGQFAKIFYTDHSIRTSVDIDFAIHESDLSSCFNLVSNLGFTPIDGKILTHSLQHQRGYFLDYQWFKSENDVPISIEFHLAPAHKALYLPLEFGNYRPSKAQPVFSKIDHALFAIIHHGIVDTWGKLFHLIDLYRIFTVLSDEEYAELVLRCKNLGIEQYLALGFYMIHQIFDVDVPIPSYTPRTQLCNEICEEAVSSRLFDKWSKNRKKIIYYLLLRSNMSDRIKSLLALMRYGVFQITGR